MKKTLFLLLPLAALLWSACSNDETYADQRKRENGAIRQYLNDSSVTVISERQFFDQDTMTDVSKNEFVLLESSGIYLQIVEKGCGEKIKDGETATVRAGRQDVGHEHLRHLHCLLRPHVECDVSSLWKKFRQHAGAQRMAFPAALHQGG